MKYSGIQSIVLVSLASLVSLMSLAPSWACAQSVRAMVMATVTNLDYGGGTSVLALEYKNTQQAQDIVSLTSPDAYFSGTTNSNGQGTMRFAKWATASVGQGMHGSHPLPKGLHAHVRGTVSGIFYNPLNPPYYNAWTQEVNVNGVPDELEVYGLSEVNEIYTLDGPGTGQATASYRFYVTGQSVGTPLDPSGNGITAWMQYQSGGHPSEFASFRVANLPNGRFAGYFNTNSYPVTRGGPTNTMMRLVTEFRTTTTNLPEASTTHGDVDFGSTIRLVGVDVSDEAGNPLTGWTLTDSEGTTYEFPEIHEDGFEPNLALNRQDQMLDWQENCSDFRMPEQFGVLRSHLSTACDGQPGTIRSVRLRTTMR